MMRKGVACLRGRAGTPPRRLAAIAVAGCVYVAVAQEAKLPPSIGPIPRSPDAYRAWRDDPTKHGNLMMESAERAAQVQSLRQRLKQLDTRYLQDQPVYDEALADQLADELYVDVGHPQLNHNAQSYIMTILIREAAALPDDRLPEIARRRLVERMLKYAEAGGSQTNPDDEAELARVLDLLGPDDVRAQLWVERLLDDGLQWAHTIGEELYLKPIERAARAHWGDVAVLRAWDLETATSRPARAELPREYRIALELLAALLTEPLGPERRLEGERRVRRATEAALASGLSEQDLRQDLVARLLIVYQRLLARRPGIPDRVVNYIQDRLLWLTAQDDRLTIERQWQLWAAAAREVGPSRVTGRFRNRIEGLLSTKKLPDERRKMLESVKLGIARE